MKNISINTRALKLLTGIIVSCSLLVISPFVTAEVKVPYNESAEKSVVNTQVIHLNESTVEQLVTLKGIGEKKAHAILAYRQQVGSFKSVQDLTKVKGIGEKVLLDNKTRLKI